MPTASASGGNSRRRHSLPPMGVRLGRPKGEMVYSKSWGIVPAWRSSYESAIESATARLRADRGRGPLPVWLAHRRADATRRDGDLGGRAADLGRRAVSPRRRPLLAK